MNKIISPQSQLSELLEDLEKKILVVDEYVNRGKIRESINAMLSQVEDPNLWDNPTEASAIMQDYNRKKKFLDELAEFKSSHETMESMMESFKDDDSMIRDILAEAADFAKTIEKAYFSTLFQDKSDDMPCFISITAGSGGTEAQDWANMLFEMYCNFGKKSDIYSYEVMEYSDKDVGIKSGVIKITGPSMSFPYGRLKGETGVHRLVRPSPFNANNKRQTSFASVIVTPVVDDSITIVINENDLRIDTYRSSGAGGQHVNKTDSAIRITHLPTGIVVQCQNDRSQHRNRAEAMRMLRSRLYILAEEERKKDGAVEKSSISWGNQIRSYVLDDSRVKDLRTEVESPQPEKVLAGEIDDFLDAYVKWRA